MNIIISEWQHCFFRCNYKKATLETNIFHHSTLISLSIFGIDMSAV